MRAARRLIVPGLLAPVLALATACGGGTHSSSSSAQRSRVEPALAALRVARFEEAARAADQVLADDSTSSVAAAVRALTRYHAIADGLFDSFTAADREMGGGQSFDDTRLRASFREAEAALGQVDRDLALAAADPGFSLELCLACWERDWNRSGEVDPRDRLLFQVEMDADGSEIPPGDPRRSPTFRFDVGDLHWARAMIAFQRAGLDLMAAYSWKDAPRAAAMIFGKAEVVRFPLVDRSRVTRARDLILVGLDHADRTRAAYLAERDDDREWVPNPAQKHHPLPLPVDAALYDTWAAVTADVRRLVRGEEGLDLGEIVRLANPEWKRFTAGFLDVGRMLSEPRDIVLDVPALNRIGEGPDALAAAFPILFGVYYVPSMKASPLVGRLARMRSEVERGDDTLGRKLRYLLWLN